MFGSIGGPELLVIFLVALLIFGPRKLPELGRMLGKGIGEFRRATNDLKSSLETEVALEETAGRQAIPAAVPESVPSIPDAAAPATDPETGEPGATGAPDAQGPIPRL